MLPTVGGRGRDDLRGVHLPAAPGAARRLLGAGRVPQRLQLDLRDQVPLREEVVPNYAFIREQTDFGSHPRQ